MGEKIIVYAYVFLKSLGGVVDGRARVRYSLRVRYIFSLHSFQATYRKVLQKMTRSRFAHRKNQKEPFLPKLFHATRAQARKKKGVGYNPKV